MHHENVPMPFDGVVMSRKRKWPSTQCTILLSLPASSHPAPVLGEHINIMAVKMIEKKSAADSKQVEGAVKPKFVIEVVELGGDMTCHH
jgi:hypothetical protein